jgi:uncharacterized protein YkwD
VGRRRFPEHKPRKVRKNLPPDPPNEGETLSDCVAKVRDLLRKLVAFGAFAAVLLLLVAPDIAPAAGKTGQTALLETINSVRRAHGLAPLRIDPTLTDAARFHTLDMLRRDYFAHGDFANRMTRFRAAGPTVGENLAWESGGSSAQFLVDAWLASPDHRANLLRPGFRRIGIGLARGSFLGHANTTVVTTDFGGN